MFSFSDSEWNPIIHDVFHSIFAKISTLLQRRRMQRFGAFELLKMSVFRERICSKHKNVEINLFHSKFTMFISNGLWPILGFAFSCVYVYIQTQIRPKMGYISKHKPNALLIAHCSGCQFIVNYEFVFVFNFRVIQSNMLSTITSWLNKLKDH